jgi:glutaminyl-peptide cyclotransferase
VRVLRRLPHPGRGFTQGLVCDGGTVWESTGGYGESRLLCYPPGAGEPAAAAPLAPELFGEGICRTGDYIWQLTWRERVALRWDARTLELLGTHRFNRDGWGICDTGETVLTSDGSSELVVRDRHSLAPTGLILARCQGRRVTGLNDLAFAGGRVWANLLGTRHLVGIDPASGEVCDIVDARAAHERHAGDTDAVMNGVAPLPGGEFLLTGKRWRHIYQVRLTPRRAGRLPAGLLPG